MEVSPETGLGAAEAAAEALWAEAYGAGRLSGSLGLPPAGCALGSMTFTPATRLVPRCLM
jgi:hypothetical protein